MIDVPAITSIILVCVPILVGIIAWFMFGWKLLLDREMVRSFEITLRHQFKMPFDYSKSVFEKKACIDGLKTSIKFAKDNHSEFTKEYVYAASNVLADMRYDMKLLACQAKADNIVEKMKSE